MVLSLYLPWHNAGLLASAIFCLAAITDWVDGYLARKLNQTTAFGAFLDPVADKLIVAVSLVVLLERHPQNSLVTLAVAVIIGREIVISALREWMAEIGARTSVAVSYVGKVKTTMQMIAIIFLLAELSLHHILVDIIGFTSLYIAAVLTLWSMIIYLKAAWKSLSKEMR